MIEQIPYSTDKGALLLKRQGIKKLRDLAQLKPKIMGILFYILKHSDSEKNAFPLLPGWQDNLAKIWGVTPRSVFAWAKALEDEGLVYKVTFSGNSWYALNRVYFTFLDNLKQDVVDCPYSLQPYEGLEPQDSEDGA